MLVFNDHSAPKQRAPKTVISQNNGIVVDILAFFKQLVKGIAKNILVDTLKKENDDT